MEESSSSTVLEGKISGIKFSLATRQEICSSSISDCPISHASQLSNPFLGLPLEAGKCESCGTAEPGQCEGHFGYIELPVPIYHPSHVSELKRILSLICLKCLKFKNRKFQSKNIGMLERAFASCCDEAAQVTVNEVKTTEGACYLELKLPARSRPADGLWDFLERYGFRYGERNARPLLPSEVMVMLKKISEDTKKKLEARGCCFQEGYIMQYLPVPPNCLSVPDVSDGITVMSSDVSTPMLKKVLKQVEIIKSSRSGMPNFESLEVEVNDLQVAVAQYLQARGTKATRERNTRYGIAKVLNDSSSTKAWLEKMKTLFISKGSGFSSRSVITGDPYKGVGEIGIPFEIAQRITFEERVNEHNMDFLQRLVDNKLCLTYRDGHSTYSLREGSKGHTFLKPGQIVHRKIMEGDVIFINRPPTTHKHSLQALSVYIHDDHTFKINPLICGPLSADFDGDCIHIFYPQSPEAKAEVLELFAVEKQLLSSHSGNVNLQLGTDSLLSLKTMFRNYFLSRAQVQQLSLFTSNPLPKPSMLKACHSGPLWTVLELLETSLPRGFDCHGDRFLIHDSKILKLDYNRDVLQSIINEIVTSIFFNKGPKEVLRFFNSLQPMLMENLCCEGFNLSLEDFIVPRDVLRSIEADIQDFTALLYHLRKNYNEVIALQLEKHLRVVKTPISNFILKFSSMGNLIDSKSDSAVTRIIQQIGFLGLQIMDKGKLYSRTLAEDLASHFHNNYPFPYKYPSEEFGLVRSCLFHGLDPYQEMVHSISSREVMVRSSRGLTEPGTLFKNLMAILRDVVICYDGTVRNVCSNSIIQFEYGVKTQSMFAAGEPVGVLAATAMSNPAYKAVLDSSSSSNSSWDMMKEILLCGVNFKNVHNDRRVILYLNDCDCGRKYCLENAAYQVKNHLRKFSLKDVAREFLIEYRRQQVTFEGAEIDAGLVGHIHLNKTLLREANISMEEVLTKCQDTIHSLRKKKKVSQLFKRIVLSFSECSFQQKCESEWLPCLKFFWQDTLDIHLEAATHIFADKVCPVLLKTIIKGDPRVKEANIIWISPETTAWIRNPCKDQEGELALDVLLEKEAVKKSGDAWRTVLDSCIPVLHLIDTRRSIPYAIKQVEDLLGISCAFEQAVQRLSTSVSMVSKGMLKEHLLLLANSMTCAGNLVGFNQAGIKALSKTLNFQVPFSEATLYTPKRCFEKAAEKCHADSLSSIVAACSWGKPVAVGTGSRFDILWDTREVELNQKDGIDIYNFLHLVRSGPEEKADSACLGGEVDSFDMEDGYMETVQSPEIDSSSCKPVFDDMQEFDFDGMDNGMLTSKSSWEKAPTSQVESSGSGWDRVVNKTLSTGTGWSQGGEPPSSAGWEGKKPEKASDPPGSWNSWGKKDVETKETGWNVKGGNQTLTDQADLQVRDSSEADQWGKKESWKAPAGSSASWGQEIGKGDRASWNIDRSEKAKENEGSGKWGFVESEKSNDASGSWDQSRKAEKDQTGWKKADWSVPKTGDQLESSAGWDSSRKTENSADQTGWRKMDLAAPNSGRQSGSSASWGKKADLANEKSKVNERWGSSESEKGYDKSGSRDLSKQAQQKADEHGWKKTNWGRPSAGDQSGSSPAWGTKGEQNSEQTGSKDAWGSSNAGQSQWGSLKANEGQDKSGSWDSVKKAEEISSQPGWSKKDWGLPKAGDLSGSSARWGSVKSDEGQDKSGSWDSGKKAEEISSQPGWRKKDWGVPKAGDQSGSSARWGKKFEQTEQTGSKKDNWGSSDSWGKKLEISNDPGSNDSTPTAEGLSNEGHEENVKSSNRGSVDADKVPEKSGSWGWTSKKVEQKADQTGWRKKDGWGPSGGGEWKNKKERPARPNDGSRASGPVTATRVRLDMFTAEEQDILADIEPTMQSIRRIMHQTGYNDGDPLSADDQTYILDNVFNYHPDKTSKMGAGVDYVMVNKHSDFQDSRCLYIVSTDGRKEDFSYRKCLENYIRGKYPDKVDSFIGKYFKKPPQRPPGWKKDRGSGPEEAGTPRSHSGWKRESSMAPDEAGTPQSQLGWNCESSTAPDEAGTPLSCSGWNLESSVTADQAGTPKLEWNKESSVAAGQAETAKRESNKESSMVPNESGTPGWGWNKGGSSSAAEEGGTSKSGWNKESNVAPNESGTPGSGWNKGVTSSAAEEGGASKSGWNKESSVAPNESGTPGWGWNKGGSSSAAEERGTPKSGWGS